MRDQKCRGGKCRTELNAEIPRNAWIFLHQILLFCSTHNCPQIWCFMLYLLDVRQNDGKLNLKNIFCNWTNVDFSFQLGCDVSVMSKTIQFIRFLVNGIPGNYTPVDYKFAHLPQEVQKVIFQRCYSCVLNIQVRLILQSLHPKLNYGLSHLGHDAWACTPECGLWSSCSSGWLRQGLNSSGASWVRRSNSSITDSVVVSAQREVTWTLSIRSKQWLNWGVQGGSTTVLQFEPPAVNEKVLFYA